MEVTEYVELLRVCRAPLMSISPGTGGALEPALIVLIPFAPNPFAEKSPITDSSAPVEDTPAKLNEYVPNKFWVPAPKTDGSWEIISPADVVDALKSAICTCCGETTTMLKNAVAA